jgi:hypothetical protein
MHSATIRPRKQRAIEADHPYRTTELAKVRLPSNRQGCGGDGDGDDYTVHRSVARPEGTSSPGGDCITLVFLLQSLSQSTPRRQHRVSECLVSALKWTIAQARLARRCIDSSAPDKRPNAARPDSSNNLVQRLRQGRPGHMKLVVMWNAAYTLPSPHASIALLENGAAAFQQLASILVLLGRGLRSSHDTRSPFTSRIHLRHRQE